MREKTDKCLWKCDYMLGHFRGLCRNTALSDFIQLTSSSFPHQGYTLLPCSVTQPHPFYCLGLFPKSGCRVRLSLPRSHSPAAPGDETVGPFGSERFIADCCQQPSGSDRYQMQQAVQFPESYTIVWGMVSGVYVLTHFQES